MNSTSLNKIAYSLLNEMRGGESSNHENIDIEQIKYAIKYYRTTFIRRDFWRNNNRFRSFEQDLGHVALDSIDSGEDPDIESGNFVLRTTQELPTPVRLKEFEGFTHVSNRDKVGENIPIIDAHRSPWQQYNKYTNNTSYGTYRNGYIYIFTNCVIDNINIRGVFEDPEEVHKFTRENGFDLYDDNSPFPAPTDMIEGIKKAILGSELKMLVQTPNDNEADFDQQ